MLWIVRLGTVARVYKEIELIVILPVELGVTRLCAAVPGIVVHSPPSAGWVLLWVRPQFSQWGLLRQG